MLPFWCFHLATSFKRPSEKSLALFRTFPGRSKKCFGQTHTLRLQPFGQAPDSLPRAPR